MTISRGLSQEMPRASLCAGSSTTNTALRLDPTDYRWFLKPEKRMGQITYEKDIWISQ